MGKVKPVIARDSGELAKALGVSVTDGHRWEMRSQLVSKIIQAVKRQRLSHAEVAARAGTSRTRVTAILNRNIDNVSTDLLLRILESLGYRVTFSAVRQKLAA